jgi:hypothetical protein
MKKKASIPLSLDVRSEIDRLVGPHGSRSAFVERVLGDHFGKMQGLAIAASKTLPIDAAQRDRADIAPERHL